MTHLPVGTEPSPYDRFYIEWGEATIKENLSVCLDVLKALLTLSLSLEGATAFLGKEAGISPTIRSALLFIFFAAAFCAFMGVVPTTSVVDLRQPEEIAAHKNRGAQAKALLVVGNRNRVGSGSWWSRWQSDLRWLVSRPTRRCSGLGPPCMAPPHRSCTARQATECQGVRQARTTEGVIA